VRHTLQFKSTTATPKLGHDPTRRQPGNDACWRTKKRTALWRVWKQKDEKVGREKPAVRGASGKNQDSLERNLDALLPLVKIETCTDSENRSSKNELRTRLQTEASSVVERKNSHGKMNQERDTTLAQCSSKQKWETDQKLLPLRSKSLKSRTSSRENEHHKITMQKVIFH
jgi:hypothetical protein